MALVKDNVKPSPPVIKQIPDDRPIWEIITELSAELSNDEWREQPADGALHYRHYLYGHPKEELTTASSELK